MTVVKFEALDEPILATFASDEDYYKVTFGSGMPVYNVTISGLLQVGGGADVDLTLYLKKDGTVAMTGSLNMSGNTIRNIPNPTQPDYVANMAYVDSKINVVYTHSQSVPSASWLINHNLGKLYPSITVINSAGDEISGGDVEPINPNSLTINFSGSFGGTAYLQ